MSILWKNCDTAHASAHRLVELSKNRVNDGTASKHTKSACLSVQNGFPTINRFPYYDVLRIVFHFFRTEVSETIPIEAKPIGYIICQYKWIPPCVQYTTL